MQGKIDATCERCDRPMQWDTLMPRVCTDCRLAACGLHPEQIEHDEEWRANLVILRRMLEHGKGAAQ